MTELQKKSCRTLELHKVLELLEKEAASVKVLSTSDKWIGITYKEDIEPAQESFSRMITAGCYPENLWI